MTSLRRVTFTCELLEDMHCGSGQGRLGIVDDCHARDAAGRPVVWSSTLMGLLRDAADDLKHLEHSLAKPERIHRLFGAEGRERSSRSSLVSLSLHFEKLPKHPKGNGPQTSTEAVAVDRPEFVVATSTAREAFSRRPLDKTLRSVELDAAGLKAHGELRFTGDEEDDTFVQLCLRRVSSIGGGKTRGQGYIRLQNVTSLPITWLDRAVAVRPKSAGSVTLRFLLRNLEPLCLPMTGYPGNIIPCESFIPGAALRGAMLTALGHVGVDDQRVGQFADPGLVQFGNGYFVPHTEEERFNLSSATVSPLPLTAEQIKTTRHIDSGEGVPGSASCPWWAADDRPPSWRDKLANARCDARASGESDDYKRVKREEYLIAEVSQPLRRVVPDKAIVMRNRTPVVRAGRNWDSRRDVDSEVLTQEWQEQDGSLFSQEVLVEDQHFVADIWFSSDRVAAQFIDSAASLLDGNAEKICDWLRLGRGGRPVCIETTRLDKQSPRTAPSDMTCFTCTLTSDLILRHPDLTFRESVAVEALSMLAGIDGDEAAEINNCLTIHPSSVSETREVHAFSTAAGTFRMPALAVKRGSAVLVCPREESNAAHRAKLRDLFKRLAQVEADGRGIGERPEDGFGRFMLNHPVHAGQTDSNQDVTAKKLSSKKHTERDVERQRRHEREEILKNVLKSTKDFGMAELCKRKQGFPKDFPSRSQWQWLRHQVEVEANIKGLLERIERHSEQLSGKMWACKLPGCRTSLIESLSQVPSEQPRTFLIHLCRWVVAQLDEQQRAKVSRHE